MSIDIDKLIKIEKADLGYTESPSGSNKTKYGVAYGQNGVPYCLIAQWYWFRKAGYSQYFYDGGKCASCSAFVNYYKTKYPNKVIYKDFKKGDLAFFNFNSDPLPDHTGLISQVNLNTVNSIEGNTGTISQDNGGKVMEKERNKSLILCAIRWWDEESSAIQTNTGVSKKVNIELNQLSNGSSGKNVENLQILLNFKGFDCGKIDGAFGNKTTIGVKQFQLKNGLVADGIVGVKSWDKLLN